MPEEIYVDNGSQYIKAQRLMENLRNGTGDAIIWRHTRPWEPWGRGKIEGKFGKLRYLLARLPGTYNKYNRRSISIARRCSNLYTYEEAVDELANHFASLNKRARKRAPSRFTLWQSFSSLKSPSIHQKTTFKGVDVVQKLVTLDDWSISFDGDEWEPKSVEGQNRKIYRLLGDAIANDEKAWLSAIKLDIGWKVEIQLHGEWVEFVRKSSQQGNAHHNADQAAMLKDLREEQQMMQEADLAVVKRIAGALPIQDAATGEYTLPSTSQTNIIEASDENNISVTDKPTNETNESNTDEEIITTSKIDKPNTSSYTPVSIAITANQEQNAPSEQAHSEEKLKSAPSKTKSKSKSKTNTQIRQTKEQNNSTKTSTSDINTQQSDNTNLDEELAGLPDFANIAEQIKSQKK